MANKLVTELTAQDKVEIPDFPQWYFQFKSSNEAKSHWGDSFIEVQYLLHQNDGKLPRVHTVCYAIDALVPIRPY